MYVCVCESVFICMFLFVYNWCVCVCVCACVSPAVCEFSKIELVEGDQNAVRDAAGRCQLFECRVSTMTLQLFKRRNFLLQKRLGRPFNHFQDAVIK